MPSTYTPLRYPGGKAKLGPFMASLMTANRLVDGTYIEPYAGGAGAAMYLLFRGYAQRVLLNDIDTAVVAFWRAVLNHNDAFVRRIRRVPLTVKEWERQRRVYRAAQPGFDLGFALFYLNRTNRSGIMNGGVIGGRDQLGTWGIDARFNREDLADRVSAIGRFRHAISVSRTDAMKLVDGLSHEAPSRAVCYLDPPYFGAGPALYTNHYSADDHAEIAVKLSGLRLPWLLTYDDCPEIRRLYKRFRVHSAAVSYSARVVRRGREVVVLGPGLRLGRPLARPRDRERGFDLVDS